MSAYVYVQSERGGGDSRDLWTVGFYDPTGAWHAVSDHDTSQGAAARVAFLNGARVPISAPGSTLEELQNDADALACALRLAKYGRSCAEADADFEKAYAAELEAGTFEHETTADEMEREHNADVAFLYQDGAGAFEPDALVTWLRQKLDETLDALAGTGMPSPDPLTCHRHPEIKLPCPHCDAKGGAR